MNLILTIKLLGSTKIRITRDNNSENVLHLKIQKFFCTFVLKKSLVSY